MAAADRAREMTDEERTLAEGVEGRLADEAGIYAAVRVRDGVAYLSGLVESPEQLEAATDLASGTPGVTRVQNDLEVEEFAAAVNDPDLAFSPVSDPGMDEAQRADVSYQMLEGDAHGGYAEPLEPDLNEPIPAVGGDMTTDAMIAVEEGIPYMPPTDPVVRPTSDEQQLEVAGGFGATSMEEFPDELATSALGDAPPGDDDVRSQVMEALAVDATTADLAIEADVRNGIAYLRGRVPTLDDAELAEEVAARVPTVREVIDELEIAALE